MGCKLSHFSVKFLCPLGHGCTSLNSFFCPANTFTCCPPVPAPKPNLLSALLRSASTPLSTCSLCLGHSLLVALESFRSIFCTCRLPPVDNTQTGKRQDHNRQGRHAETHATEHAAEQQDSQQRVHNRTIQMVQSCSPSAATNLTHQLVASNL